MALSTNYLSPDERDAWRALLDDALNGSRQADPAAVGRAMAALDQADRAGAEWPTLIRAQAVRTVLQAELKRYAKAEAMTAVTYNGTPLVRTARRGVRQQAADGSTTYEQKLLWDMDWPEVDTWAASNESQIHGLLANRDIARKLQDLRRMAPRSTGPADAASQLGTTVEAVLAS